MAEIDRRWSPYSYGHNNPIRFIDVDGMFVKPGDLFTSADAAAKDFGHFYNGKSIMNNQEYNSDIYTVSKGGRTYYTYGASSENNGELVSTPLPVPVCATVVANAHTHDSASPNAPPDENPNQFSKEDTKRYEKRKIDGYVATPDGSLKKYDNKTGKTSDLSDNMPSDPKDPNRKNDISPLTGTSTKKDIADGADSNLTTKPDATKVAPPVIRKPDQ